MDARSTRREALRRIVLIGGASAAILGASGLVIFLSKSLATQQAPKAVTAAGNTASISVKVYYVGMTNTLGTSEETVQVPASTTLSELFSDVCVKHPVIETMHSMQILLNGTIPGGDPTLSGGDEVILMANMVGG